MGFSVQHAEAPGRAVSVLLGICLPALHDLAQPGRNLPGRLVGHVLVEQRGRHGGVPIRWISSRVEAPLSAARRLPVWRRSWKWNPAGRPAAATWATPAHRDAPVAPVRGRTFRADEDQVKARREARRARPCGRRGAPSSDGAATRCYPILRATATTPTSRPRAPVTDRTTRHHGRYRWNPSPDARECAPSHRRRPGAARSFRPPPHPSTGPFHSRKESRSRKHLAADPWTPPPSRLVSASIG